jgi:hypothetical protein
MFQMELGELIFKMNSKIFYLFYILIGVCVLLNREKIYGYRMKFILKDKYYANKKTSVLRIIILSLLLIFIGIIGLIK